MALDTKNEMSLRTIPKQLGITKPTGITMPPMVTAKLPKSCLRKDQVNLKEFLTALNETMFHSVHGTGSYLPKVLELALYETGLQMMQSLAEQIWESSTMTQWRKWPMIKVENNMVKIHKTPRMCFQRKRSLDLDQDLQSLRFRIYWQNVCDFYGNPAHYLVPPDHVAHTLKLSGANEIVLKLKNSLIEPKKRPAEINSSSEDENNSRKQKNNNFDSTTSDTPDEQIKSEIDLDSSENTQGDGDMESAIPMEYEPKTSALQTGVIHTSEKVEKEFEKILKENDTFDHLTAFMDVLYSE